MIGKCGVRCDLCPAYRPRLAAGPEARDELVRLWKDYLGISEGFSKKAICDGCLADEKAGASLVNKYCRVRRCAAERGYANCAHCDEFTCDKELNSLLIMRRIRGRFEKGEFPAEDYDRVFVPYDMEGTLRAIRRKLGREGKNDYVLSRLLDKKNVPSETKLRRHAGAAGEAWTALRRFIKKEFPLLAPEVHFQARHAGWGLRYVDGKKPLRVLFPEGEAFVVHLTAKPDELGRAGFPWEKFARRRGVYVEDYRKGSAAKKI